MSDHLAYIAIVNLGKGGQIFLDTDVESATRDNVIDEILAGEIDRPVRVIEIDPAQCDISRSVAKELVDRAWRDGITLTDGARQFAELHGVSVPTIERKGAGNDR
jgi:hypothetical protein